MAQLRIRSAAAILSLVFPIVAAIAAAQPDISAYTGPPTGIQWLFTGPSGANTPAVVLDTWAYVGTKQGVVGGNVLSAVSNNFINNPPISITTAYPVTALWNTSLTQIVAVANDTLYAFEGNVSTWNFTSPGFSFDFAATMTGQYPMPLVWSSTIFIGTRNNNWAAFGSPGWSWVFAIDVTTGAVKWQANISAAYTNYQIQLWSEMQTVAVRATNPGNATLIYLLSAVDGTMLPFAAATLYAAAGNWLPQFAVYNSQLWINDYCGYLAIVNVSTNASLTQSFAGCSSTGFTPALINNTVYVASGDYVYAYSSQWPYEPVGGGVYSSAGSLQQVVPFGPTSYIFCGPYGLQTYNTSTNSFAFAGTFFSPQNGWNGCQSLSWADGLLVVGFGSSVFGLNVAAGTIAWENSGLYGFGPITVIPAAGGSIFVMANSGYTSSFSGASMSSASTYTSLVTWRPPRSPGWDSSNLNPSGITFFGTPYNVVVVQSYYNDAVSVLDAYNGSALSTLSVTVGYDDPQPVLVGDYACSCGYYAGYCVALVSNRSSFNVDCSGYNQYPLTVNGDTLYWTSTAYVPSVQSLNTSAVSPQLVPVTLPNSSWFGSFTTAVIVGKNDLGQTMLFGATNGNVLYGIAVTQTAASWVLSTFQWNLTNAEGYGCYFSTNVVQLPGDSSILVGGVKEPRSGGKGSPQVQFGLMKFNATTPSFIGMYTYPSVTTNPRSLVAGDDFVLIVGWNNVTAVDRNGGWYWSQALGASTYISSVVLSSGVALVSTAAGTFYALDSFTGAILWSPTASSSTAAVRVVSGLVLWGSPTMRLTNLITGELVASFQLSPGVLGGDSSSVWVYGASNSYLFGRSLDSDLPPPSQQRINGSFPPSQTTAPAAGPAAVCVTLTECAACTAQLACGWAADLSLCLPGTSSGPDQPYNSTQWDWEPVQCVAPTIAPSNVTCGASDSCQSCLDTPNCGWAADLAACLLGTGDGPAQNYSSAWRWATCDAPNIPPFGFMRWYSGSAAYTSGSESLAVAGASTDSVIAQWEQCTYNCPEPSGGTIRGLDSATGALMWTYNTSGQYAWFSGKADRFIALTQQSVAVLRAADGLVLWNSTLTSLTGGLTVNSALAPAWVGEDALVFSVTFWNQTEQTMLLWLNVTHGARRVLWNSYVLGQPWVYAAGSPVVGFVSSGPVVVQMFESFFFVVVNLTHPEAAVVGNWSGLMLWSEYATGPSHSILNDHIFLFGPDPMDGTTGRVVSYDLSGRLIRVVSFPSMGSLLTVVPWVDGGTNSHRFAFTMVAVNGEGNCVLASGDSSGMRTSFALRSDCSVAAEDEQAIFILDDTDALYRYDHRSQNISWVTAALGTGEQEGGGSALMSRVFGDHLFGVYFVPLNGSYTIDVFIAQINVHTGQYVAVFPVPWRSEFAWAQNVFFHDPALGIVFALGTNNYNRPSVLALIPHTVGSMLALPAAATQPPAVNASGRLQYYVTPSSVTSVSSANQSILWCAAFPSDTFGQVPPTISGSKLAVFADYGTLFVYDAAKAPANVTFSLSWGTPDGAVSSGQPAAWAFNGSLYYMQDSSDIAGLSLETGVYAGSKWIGWDGVEAYAFNNQYLIYSNGNGLGTMTWSGFPYGPSTSQSTSNLGYQLVATSNSVFAGHYFGWAQYTVPQLERVLEATTPLALDTSVPPLVLGTNIFLSSSNGSVLSYSIVSLSITPILRFIASPPITTYFEYSLGTPVVTPWGLLVYANSNGIFCIDSKTGAIPHVITQTASGVSLSCASPIAYGAGLVFVVCNAQLQMVDVIVGRIWRGGAVLWFGTSYLTVDSSDEHAIVVTQAIGTFVSLSTLTDVPYDYRNISRYPPRYTANSQIDATGTNDDEKADDGIESPYWPLSSSLATRRATRAVISWQTTNVAAIALAIIAVVGAIAATAVMVRCSSQAPKDGTAKSSLSLPR